MIKLKSSHYMEIDRTPAFGNTRLDSIRLDKNEFLPCWPEEWFSEFLKRIRPEHLSVHPEPGSVYEKLEKVLGIPRRNIVITAGSDGGIRSVFEVFVDAGDEAIILNPTFAMYYVYGKIFNARTTAVDFDQNLEIDPERIIKSIGSKTRLIAIANPNSPTGTIFSQNDLLSIVDAASGKGIPVLIDEAYYPFYEESMVRHIEKFDNLIITRTFSKAAGLAGMRIGFLMTNEELAKAFFAVKPMYEVTSLSLLSAEIVLDNYHRVLDYARRTMAGKAALALCFSEHGYQVNEGFANFLHVDFRDEKSSIINFLKNRKILFREHFDHPSLRCFSRFTVGPVESVSPLVAAIEDYHKHRSQDG